MHRPEDNRFLPVFALLALIITIQSFLIGEDRKHGDFDRPVVSQNTPFVTPRSAPANPQLAIVRPGDSAMPETSGPQTADEKGDGGWVPYQAGQTAADDDPDEPPPSPAPRAQRDPDNSARPAAKGDDTAPLAEETRPDEADALGGARDAKDEFARPMPLQEIIQEATRTRTPMMSSPAPAPAPVMSASPAKATTCEVDIGDNLWKIAHRYHVSGEDILKANKLSSGVLLPGQVLVIPQTPQITIPAGYEAVHVRDGETAIDVANRLGVPLIDLVRENDLASLYQIPSGTVLRYKKPGAPEKKPAQISSNPAKSGLFFPVNGKVGDRFGWRRHPILDETLFHTGVDLRAPRGEPIRAAQDGRVIYAGWLRGYGQTLVIRHAGGYTTRYAHCSALLKKRGDWVKRAEKIAKVGSSGLSTGPHVHFEVRLMGKPLNPLKFLKGKSARS